MRVQLTRVPVFLLLAISTLLASDSRLPEGKGKDIIEGSCADCHSLENIYAQRLDEEGWNSIVREMIENGAQIEPKDLKIIAEYLAKNFGPGKKVNINQAQQREIAAVLKLEAAEAAAIVQYRTEHGKFKDLDELKKVNGLSVKLEARKALIDF